METTPTPETETSSNAKYYIGGFFIFVIVCFVIYFFVYKKKEKDQPKPPSGDSSPTPPPTPEPKPDDQLKKVLRGAFSKDSTQTTMQSSGKSFREPGLSSISGNKELMSFIGSLKKANVIPENCSLEKIYNFFTDCKSTILALDIYEKNKDSNLFCFQYIFILLLLFGVENEREIREEIVKFATDNGIKLNVTSENKESKTIYKEKAKIIYDSVTNCLNMYFSNIIVIKKAKETNNTDILTILQYGERHKEDMAEYILKYSSILKDSEEYDYLEIRMNNFNQNFKPTFTKQVFDEKSEFKTNCPLKTKEELLPC